MTDREALFSIDGVTNRADCDATYDFDNANKLNLIPVRLLSNSRNMHEFITVRTDYVTLTLMELVYHKHLDGVTGYALYTRWI